MGLRSSPLFIVFFFFFFFSFFFGSFYCQNPPLLPQGVTYVSLNFTDFATVALGETIFVIGGFFHENSHVQPVPFLYEWYADGSVKNITTLPTPRGGLSALIIDSKIFTIGGSQSPNGPPLTCVEVYDLIMQSWSSVTLEHPRYLPLLTVYQDSKVIVALGGGQAGGYIEVVDALSLNLTQLPSLPDEAWSCDARMMTQVNEEELCFICGDEGSISYSLVGEYGSWLSFSSFPWLRLYGSFQSVSLLNYQDNFYWAATANQGDVYFTFTNQAFNLFVCYTPPSMCGNNVLLVDNYLFCFFDVAPQVERPPFPITKGVAGGWPMGLNTAQHSSFAEGGADWPCYPVIGELAIRWSTTRPQPYLSTTLISEDGVVFFCTANGNCSAYSIDGTRVWDSQLPIGEDFTQSGALGTDGVFYLSSENTLYGLNATNGHIITSWTNTSISSLTISADNTLYFSVSAGAVAMRLEGDTLRVIWSQPFPVPWQDVAPTIAFDQFAYFVSRDNRLSTLYAFDLVTGERLSNLTWEPPLSSSSLVTTVSFQDNTFYIPDFGGYVFALNVSAESHYPYPEWKAFEVANSLPSSMAVNGRIVANTRAAEGGLWILNITNGSTRLLYTPSLPTQISITPTLTNNTIYYCSPEGLLQAYDAWTLSLKFNVSLSVNGIGYTLSSGAPVSPSVWSEDGTLFTTSGFTVFSLQGTGFDYWQSLLLK